MSNYSVVLVDEKQTVELQCLVSSFPSSIISWIFNDQILSTNQTTLKIDHLPIGFYICTAHHPLFGIFNQTIRVALKGPPEMLEETTIHSAYVGQSALLVCSISKDIPTEVCCFRFENSLQYQFSLGNLLVT